MKRIEIIFLVCVLAAAALFAAHALHLTAHSLGLDGADVSGAAGSAGEPREVDMKKLRMMIRGGSLSDHEALFYEGAPGP